jgi:hypothetical protein
MYEAETNVANTQVAEVLRRCVARARFFSWPNTAHPFVGRVSSRRFRITLLVQHRDSFRPMLYGRFYPLSEGTRVRVLFTFHPIVWIFMLLLSIGAGSSLLLSVQPHDRLDHIITVVFLLFMWSVAIVFFYANARESKRLLIQCLDLTEVKRLGV